MGRLVAGAFIGTIVGCLQVNHKNGVRSDDNADNLELVTPSQNQLHAFAALGRDHFRGESAPQAKLSDDEIRCIRALALGGTCQKMLSERFRVAQSCISKIVNRRAWKHIS